MGKLEIDVNEIKKLAKLVEKHHLEELTVEHDDVCVTVKGKASKPVSHVTNAGTEYICPTPTASLNDFEPEQTSAIEPTAIDERNIVDIVAPLVGVFYRAASPDAPAMVEIGDVIEVGTEVGLIEAMKVFSPIPSEVSGKILEIVGQNGTLVREGDVLIRVQITEE